MASAGGLRGLTRGGLVPGGPWGPPWAATVALGGAGGAGGRLQHRSGHGGRDSVGRGCDLKLCFEVRASCLKKKEKRKKKKRKIKRKKKKKKKKAKKRKSEKAKKKSRKRKKKEKKKRKNKKVPRTAKESSERSDREGKVGCDSLPQLLRTGRGASGGGCLSTRAGMLHPLFARPRRTHVVSCRGGVPIPTLAPRRQRGGGTEDPWNIWRSSPPQPAAGAGGGGGTSRPVEHLEVLTSGGAARAGTPRLPPRHSAASRVRDQPRSPAVPALSGKGRLLGPGSCSRALLRETGRKVVVCPPSSFLSIPSTGGFLPTKRGRLEKAGASHMALKNKKEKKKGKKENEKKDIHIKCDLAMLMRGFR